VNPLLLLFVFAVQPAPKNAAEIGTAWAERAAVESADIELAIERDSRDRTFGATGAVSSDSRVRLRFTPELYRLDAQRLTAVRRDGRTQPAEANPDRARIEFRNVLLEEQLAGPQKVPRIEPATLIVNADGRERGLPLSVIDRLLGEAPLWSIQPLRFLDRARLTVEENAGQADWRRVTANQRTGGLVELWVDRSPAGRPLRIIHRIKDRAIWQIDFSYSEAEPQLASRYVVQTIGHAGEALDFLEASLARIEVPTTPLDPVALAKIDLVDRDAPRLPSPSAIQLRGAIRRALDSQWLPLAAMGLCALVLLRRRAASPPSAD